MTPVAPHLNFTNTIVHAVPWHLLKIAGESLAATTITAGTLAAATCIIALRRNPK